MTYAQSLRKLWIKKAPTAPLKDIHRFNPRLRACFTGGFEVIFPLYFNKIRYFSTKSGPTITT
jgi:hypothetical protein